MPIIDAPDGQPRNQCLRFVTEMTALYGPSVLLPRSEFDRLARAKEFTVGPLRDSFGDGYGEPYNPHRQVFGIVKDGRMVYAELNREFNRKLQERAAAKEAAAVALTVAAEVIVGASFPAPTD